MKPVIVLCPARNEGENLRALLPTWLTFADHVIIADQSDDDQVIRAAEPYPNVLVVPNPDSDFHEGSRILLLSQTARERFGEGIFLSLDADETLSANVLDSKEWRAFRASPPGTTGSFPWVTLWRSSERYVTGDGIGGPYPNRLAFVDDGRTDFPTTVMHGARGIGLDDTSKEFIFEDVVILHYLALDFDRLNQKQNWYKCWWLNKNPKYYHVNRNHAWPHLISDADTAPTPDEWFSGYEDLGLTVRTIAREPGPSWYQVDVLRWMAERSPEFYHGVDMWEGEDWEAVRQDAVARGVEGVPASPIVPASSARVAYQRALRFTARQGSSLPWKAFRFALRKVLP